jgi:DNA polymerase/3'-5' exonuclease PolX
MMAILSELRNAMMRQRESYGHVAIFRHFRCPASSLRRLPRPLGDLIDQQALQTIPGIGAAIAKRIERMRRTLPTGLL